MNLPPDANFPPLPPEPNCNEEDCGVYCDPTCECGSGWTAAVNQVAEGNLAPMTVVMYAGHAYTHIVIDDLNQ